MGTWGTTAFEDDTAMDYFDDFCSSDQSIKLLEGNFDMVLSRQYNMDDFIMEGYDEPIAALVSAEIIAASIGKQISSFPDNEYYKDLDVKEINLEKIKNEVTTELKQKAISTIKKITSSTTNMHLTTLWFESESFQEWKQYTDELILRLS